VFNRWGERIFYSKGYDEPWDGKTKNGKDLPAGTYYYIINFHDALNLQKTKTGPITILR
ncbi:MAG: gliding motility-associated C-terminal domain-containing protein, partial [Chlorobi bacterium]|nr:gliding motility-associated C-terminal domain-containing protein [Chlorobiota bacterium]